MACQLRLATYADASALHAIYAPIVESTTISFEFVAPSPDEMATRVTTTLQHYPWLVCENSASILGYAYASQHHSRLGYQWATNVSVYVHPQARRQGVGQGLYTTLFAMLRVQGYYVAYAGITLPNTGSVRLHESLGFRSIGVYQAVGYKFGAWHDVGWWQRDLVPRQPHPAAPLPLGEIIGSPAWADALASGVACIRSS